MRRARTDANQQEVVDALRQIGAAVTPIHRVGGGCADLLVSFRQDWFVIEVKVGKARLNKLELDWHAEQHADVLIVRGPHEAVAAVLKRRQA